MSIKLVVCDLAGTTVKDNRDVHKKLQSALRKGGINITLNDANEVMGLPKPIAIRLLFEKRKAEKITITNEWVDEVHKNFINEMISFYHGDKMFDEKEGVTETFRVMKDSGIKIFVDTGFDRKITNAILERVGWARKGLIDGSVTSDEVKNGRPHPDLVFEAMRLAGVTNPTDVVKVGDTISDLIEGNNAGCGLVVGITSGAFPKERLELEKHTHLIEQLPQMLDILKLR